MRLQWHALAQRIAGLSPPLHDIGHRDRKCLLQLLCALDKIFRDQERIRGRTIGITPLFANVRVWRSEN